MADGGNAAGITLSPQQVFRGSQMAADSETNNVFFRSMDALAMEFKDNSFDLVWACESGEHMPDKRKYIESMTRVLKPGECAASSAPFLPSVLCILPFSCGIL
jgi:MPBQ/MSBQ methyltransferase